MLKNIPWLFDLQMLAQPEAVSSTQNDNKTVEDKGEEEGKEEDDDVAHKKAVIPESMESYFSSGNFHSEVALRDDVSREELILAVNRLHSELLVNQYDL